MIVDAGDPPDSDSYDGRWRVAHGVGLVGSGTPGVIAPLLARASKAARVCHSSFDAECVGGVSGMDEGLDFAQLVREILFGRRLSLLRKLEMRVDGAGPQELRDPRPSVMVSLHTDADDVVTKCKKKCLRGMTKRRKNDIADLQELVSLGLMYMPIHISGKTNPFDALTKDKAQTKRTAARLAEWMLGHYSPM